MSLSDPFRSVDTACTPAISVLTSMHNAADYLAPAIESVLGQTFADFEFLILDDGSTDDSGRIAASYAAHDSRIRLTARENRGLVASLNHLIDQARAPLLARFDADDLCYPRRFERQIAFLAGHPDHGVVGCETTYIDQAGQPAPNAPLRRPIDHTQIMEHLEEGPLFCHSAVMMRRDLVLSAGGYRKAYRHAEDYDLWLRLSAMTKLHNLPECLLSYRVTAGQVSNRHMVEQACNAGIAWLAHGARVAGQGDPTEALDVLPSVDALDAMFGDGAAAYVRRRVVDRVLFAPETLATDGWDMLVGHIADEGAHPRLWRAAARLLRAGRPLHAARAAVALLRNAA